MKKRRCEENDGYITYTTLQQHKTEEEVGEFLKPYRNGQSTLFYTKKILKEDHVKYLFRSLEMLPFPYVSLDASKPWLIYWITHALDLLIGFPLKDHEEYEDRIIDTLKKCESSKYGGYGGGPGQLPHLATTYAGINAITILGTEKAYKSINRKSLYQFLIKSKTKEGGFLMHDDGELDIRGCYCALVCAFLTNTITSELIAGVADHVLDCQTFEGGFACIPKMSEAHGGYTFCGVACLMLLKHIDKVRLDNLIHWTVRRQMRFEGGFQGRTNKLVDSCYSFWVGAIFPMLNALISSRKKEITKSDLNNYDCLHWSCPTAKHQKIVEEKENMKDDEEDDDEESKLFPELINTLWLFDQTALQEYVIVACQGNRGGLRDKPSKSPDPYHSCYSLGGTSIAQHNPNGKTTVLGSVDNELRKNNPIFNVCEDKMLRIMKYFGNRTKI